MRVNIGCGSFLCHLRRTSCPESTRFGFRTSFGPRSSPSDFQGLCALGILLCPACPGLAQLPTPHIGYVYPAGGRQSATFEVVVGGQFLDGVTNAHVSGTGVRAAVVAFNKPLTPQQANQLREKMQQLQEKRQASNQGNRKRGASSGSQSSTNTWTFADQQMLMEIRQKLVSFQRRPANPAIAETATLQITVSPEAEPGEREIRIGAQLGLSNPLLFCVGQLPEFSKKNPRLNEEPPTSRPARNNNNEQKAAPPTEMSISIPAVVNGQIQQGGVDRYRFQGKKGQRLVVAVAARQLIPYLADAVPGWFQAALSTLRLEGTRTGLRRPLSFSSRPGSPLRRPPRTANTLQIRDSIYRGRDDFVYRITVGEVPYITASSRSAARRALTTAVNSAAGIFPTRQSPRINRGLAPGVYPLTVRTEKFFSNASPVCRGYAAGMSFAKVESFAIRRPARGRCPSSSMAALTAPGDWDVFRFEGRAGDDIVAEVYARRLDSPLDSVLKLTDDAGNQLAFNDDNEDKGPGLKRTTPIPISAPGCPRPVLTISTLAIRPTAGRPGIRLPPAHQRAPARLRPAGRAFQRRRAGWCHGSPHGVCAPPGRLHE
jgi:hypothetical protein